MDYLKDFEIAVKESKNGKGYSKAQQNREFLENLKSYSSKGWWHMPAILYPNMCSLYGWKCGKEECLICRKCGASLLLRPPATDSEKDLIEVTKCFESLSTKHESTCTYKESPMPHNLLYMPLISPEEFLQEVIINYREGKHEIIPTIFSPNFEDRMEEYDSLISWIIEKSGQSEASRNNRKTMLIILSGWKIQKKCKVECGQCFRALGLWNYLSDLGPEPKRLSSEEWDKQKEEFIKEYSRVGTTEEYPAQDAERYEKEDDRMEKPNESLKETSRVKLKVPEESEKDNVSRVGTIEEYPIPDAERYGKEDDQVLKSNGSMKESPGAELEVPEGSDKDIVNRGGTAKEYPAQDAQRYGKEEDQVQKSDGSMKETQKVELQVPEESEKDDIHRIGTAEVYLAEDAERYEKEDNRVEKPNASMKESPRVELKSPDKDVVSTEAAESLRPQNIDKSSDENFLEEKPKLESQTQKDSDLPRNKKKKMEEKPILDPLAEHFPWCRWVFVGFGNVTKDVSPSWLQRIEVITQLMIQDKILRKSKSHVFTPVLLDSALHPT